jgi:hypothetical protein
MKMRYKRVVLELLGVPDLEYCIQYLLCKANVEEINIKEKEKGE